MLAALLGIACIIVLALLCGCFCLGMFDDD